MFTASELLEKINSHITVYAYSKGIVCSGGICSVYGWKANSPGINVDGL